jgi:hypothetical protein
MYSEQELKEIHKKSSYHLEEIDKSLICGCFYCLKTCNPSDVVEWTDGGETALCPHCGIDSLLPEEFVATSTLKEMRKYYFLQGFDQYGNLVRLDGYYK